MPRFEPFAGIRYDPSKVTMADVVAPPYDVIGPEEQAALEARSPYNAVRVELARDEGGQGRYELARQRLDDWLAAGVLTTDAEPGFYIYRMGYRDQAGRPRQTTGVLGALGLEGDDDGDGARDTGANAAARDAGANADTIGNPNAAPGNGARAGVARGVLPHERTMAKPKHDRLNLLRATRANLSPIWGLSMSRGLSALCDVAGAPIARCTDDHGVHHRLWRVTEPGLVEAIRATVAAASVIIADGHHRYATALAFREERRAEVAPARRALAPADPTPGDAPRRAPAPADPAPADHDFVLAYVVELAEDEISVGAIHRVVSELPDDFEPLGALAGFSARRIGDPDPEAVSRASDAGLPALVTTDGVWLLEPDDSTPSPDPDAARLLPVLDGWPPHSLAYRHSADEVLAAVTKGEAQVGLLLRPPTVAQIAATATSGRRMPEKTTFFWPKPLTGLVFRRLRD